MKRVDVPTADRVRELFTYDAETGIFRWRVKRTAHRAIGDIAGSISARDYWRLRVDQATLPAHRVAWLYVHGVWPENLIDHIDGNGLNNSINNLRPATRVENCRNNKRRGYCLDKSKKTPRYRAYIYIDNKQINLGTYSNKEQARAAYLAATKKFFGAFSVTNREAAI